MSFERSAFEPAGDVVPNPGGPGSDRALGARRAVGEEASERRLEGSSLVARLLAPRGRGVHGSVEHKCTNAAREEMRIDRAEPGAVRETDVGELVVPERFANAVEVARHVHGPEER
jgi:hypothetical protein